MRCRRRFVAKLVFAVGCLAHAIAAPAQDAPEKSSDQLRITFRDAQKTSRTVDGRLIVEAQDGGILLLGRDGRQWNIEPGQIEARTELEGPFKPLTQDETVAALKAELGSGFDIVTTRHYVIASAAGTRYAKWCGALFERLMEGFQTHWRGRPLELFEPKLPLVAVILADEKQFAAYASQDIGPQAAVGANGYYSWQSNRMVLYDLTAGPESRPARTFDDITDKIRKSPFNVATVVHEATHQIAFNSGLHVRQADNPVWLTEGMAMYFETPDLNSRAGWKTIGHVNETRLRQFRDYASGRRKADSLSTLVAADVRFTDVEQAADAYAEAWCLTHFLVKTRRKAYTEYLARIAAKPPLVFGGPEKRLEEFREAFGDLDKLDRDFVKYVERLK